MERGARLAAMRRIIENQKVSSQEDLLRRLEEEGFLVTQATLSRDLKAMEVGKLPDGRGGYIYAFPDSASRAGSEKTLIEDFLRYHVEDAYPTRTSRIVGQLLDRT